MLRHESTTRLYETTRHWLGVSLLAGAGALFPLPGQAVCRTEAVEMPVKMVGSRAVATVGINGTAVPLTVDSGAFYSFLTDAAVAQLQLPVSYNSALHVEGITGKVETRIATVEKLQLFKGNIPNVEFVAGGNEPGAGTMGLMGRNLLAFADTEYDLANGVIRFHFPGEGCADADMAYWAGATPVTEVDLLVASRRDKTPPIRAHVKLNGTQVVALFDTGATTVVSARAARRAGLADADLTPSFLVYGAGRGSARSWIGPFDKFEFGGETIRNNRLRVAEFGLGDADMLLGIDFFLSHRIYVSKAQAKLFVTYNGGTVFAQNRAPNGGPATSNAEAAASGVQLLTADQYARRGAAAAARGEFERALTDLNRACELEPAVAACFAQRALVHEALRRPVKALEDFDKALALDPSNADARLQRAVLRARTNDRAESLADLDASLPAQAQIRLAMSRPYQTLERPAQSLAQLNQWLPAHPNEAQQEAALNNRCWVRLRLDVKLDKARDDCNEAVDADSKNAAYLDSRGWVYLRMGNYRRALADFDRSPEMRPDGPWSLYGRGLTKAGLNGAAQGEADLLAARKLDAGIDESVKRAGLPTDPVRKP